MDATEIENAAAGILRIIERSRKLEKLARLTQETRKAQKEYFKNRTINTAAARDWLQQSKVLETRLDAELTEILNLNPPF